MGREPGPHWTGSPNYASATFAVDLGNAEGILFPAPLLIPVPEHAPRILHPQGNGSRAPSGWRRNCPGEPEMIPPAVHSSRGSVPPSFLAETPRDPAAPLPASPRLRGFGSGPVLAAIASRCLLRAVLVCISPSLCPPHSTQGFSDPVLAWVPRGTLLLNRALRIPSGTLETALSSGSGYTGSEVAGPTRRSMAAASPRPPNTAPPRVLPRSPEQQSAALPAAAARDQSLPQHPQARFSARSSRAIPLCSIFETQHPGRLRPLWLTTRSAALP